MIFLILAIYNEESSLPFLIKDIRNSLKEEAYKIIAVDDGSADRSLSILEELKGDDIIIAHHKINLSIGAVFSTGFNIALNEASSDNDIVVLMESDQTSNPNLLRMLIEEIRSKGNDIAIASRFIQYGGYVNFPFLRKIYSVLANFILKYFFPIQGVRDYTIFYRCYRVRILREIKEFFGIYHFIQSRGFVSNSELLIKASCFTNRISEIPFKYDYGDKKGKSKMRILSNILEYVHFIFFMRHILKLVTQYKQKNNV